MIISISGTPGSGKSTVAEILSKILNMKRYYIGGLRRDMAKKRGLTLDEYNKIGEQDPSTDNEVDEYQTELGQKEDNFIIEGRTSFYFIPQSIKIFIDVDLKEASRRIFNSSQSEMEKRNEHKYSSQEDVLKYIESRMASDVKRYMKYYSFDCYDTKHYDFVVDTTSLTPQQAVDKILDFLRTQKLI